MRLPKKFSSWLVIGLLVIILVSLSVGEFGQWRKRSQIQAEINNVMQQQQALSQKNTDLANSLALLNTPDYKEKLAREQLGLKKDGEIVVNFPSSLPSGNVTVSTQTNPQKWWKYFFKN